MTPDGVRGFPVPDPIMMELLLPLARPVALPVAPGTVFDVVIDWPVPGAVVRDEILPVA